ncbi:IPT/TIG domain-containing protein [Leeuwenhoekiella sp.]|uniref:IPT/TIG domain-containing protein n=1 Tax=Leeuwenhoekiella sp. TaxID=1977054 RepID=UPI000C56C217|nr:IPT/TIG domain-containing protein [Leeuwenhoekiella sp.]MBA80261.1 hypothetical protein [Leeuwenhoekiella sp.]
MKSFFTYFTMIFILIGCSNNDENPTQETPKNLVVISYFPSSAMAGEEITFVVENIIVSKEYTILFNGIASEAVQNFQTEIKAIVPSNATTGEIVIKYDDKNLNVGTLEITEEPTLLITSFSPTTAFKGDEITFVGENIDPAITYAVFFNGIEGETASVTENEIVAIVPQGATSGEITISYEDSIIAAGTIEITNELDKLYGYFPVEGAGCEAFYIYSLDINTGALLEEQTLLNALNCYSYISSNFYRNTNIFVHTFSEHWAQGQPLYKNVLIKNFNTGYQATWILRDEGDRDGSILAAYDNKIYYSYRYFPDVDETYEVRVRNLDTGITTTVYNFPLDYMYDFKNSGFLPSTNELVFFTKNESDQPIFMKLNVETSTLTSYNISETYSSIFITKTERIFGIKSLGGYEHEIVEIDKSTGNILSSLATISAQTVEKIDYSLSSNRIFALLRDTNYGQYLYTLNLDDGTSTNIQLDEQNTHKDFYGIYLND